MKQEKEIKMPTREQFDKMTDEEKKALWEAAKQQNETKKTEKSDKMQFIKNNKKLIIIISIIVAMGLCAIIAVLFNASDSPLGSLSSNSVITDSPEKVIKVEKPKKGEEHAEEQEHVQFMINPAIIVKGKRMTFIDFHNLNAGKEMKVQIKMKGEKDYVYKSPTVKEGKALMEGDLKIEPPEGQSAAIADMVAYDKKGKEVDSESVEIVLIQRGEK